MAQTVWKYDLGTQEYPALFMPKGARILTVAVQHDAWRLWALVDPDAPKEMRYFQIAGTGQPLDDDPTREYIGTFQVNGGAYIFHLFAIDPAGKSS